MSASSFSWLHLTDFHFGLHRQKHLWPSLRQPWFDDLARLHAKTGPWHVVFFTGDLVQQGTPGEFTGMQRDMLDKLWDSLSELGSGNAQLLAVPGNHDLCRPDPSVDNPAADALLADGGFAGIEAKFWATSNNSYRQVINNAFNAYTQWWEGTDRRPAELSRGELPGDFACTLTCGEHRIGIIGLNTAFLQLKGGDFKGKLVWDVQQLSTVCGGAVDEWAKRHSLCLLLTHQGPEWLTTIAQEHGQREIAPDGRFALHLFGHMHEHALTYMRCGGSPDASRLCQGSSIFGMEILGESPTTMRSHGYAAGKIDFTPDGASLRLWPRVATDKPSGWRFIPDFQGHYLDADEGTPAEALPFRPQPAPPQASPDPVAVSPHLPGSLSSAIVVVEAPSEVRITPRAIRLYGRDMLLQQAVQFLHKRTFLLVYGMRGNGKTEFIKALAGHAPLQGRELVRIMLDPAITADYLFRQLANLLGDTSELPSAPYGDAASISEEIRQRYPSPRPAWIWLEQAHHLLGKNGFRSDILQLLSGLHTALGNQWYWVLELRECPPPNAFSEISHHLEVPGLNKASLGEWLMEAAPAACKNEWTYKGDQLKAIYQWLGTDHDNRAHPLATQILIEVALDQNETPREVLQRHREHLDLGIENRLLGDLYNKVLTKNEQQLIQALALYRKAIPHDHLEQLEENLTVPGAWDGLDRRCLLPANADGSKFYLHSFIAAWVRTHQLGYADHGEDSTTDFAEATTAALQQPARQLHAMIANCWLQQLGSSRKATLPNIERALEAFYHLVAAGDADRVTGIATTLLTGNLGWAKQRIESLYQHLYSSKAAISSQRQVLEYWASLEPENHKVQRFLGECWAKEEGKASARALQCFEEACRLVHDYPHYWANLGRSLLAQGEVGARDFLLRLTDLEQNCPQAIDNHVRAIQADCLVRVGLPALATALNMEQIDAGSLDAAFYANEALVRRDAGNLQGALKILDLAEQRGIANHHTRGIRISVLKKLPS